MTPWSMLLGSKHSRLVALKSKVHMAQNWLSLEKPPPFLQFSSKISDFFLVKDLTNRLLFHLIVSFWEHTFLARMWCLKNRWPLSAPPRAYFYHPQLIKKKLRSFDENWRNTSDICIRWVDFFSTHFSWPHYPGKIQNYTEQIFLTVGQNNYGNKIPNFNSILVSKWQNFSNSQWAGVFYFGTLKWLNFLLRIMIEDQSVSFIKNSGNGWQVD